MTTARIVYTRPDGGVSVVIPADEARREGESESTWLARVAQQALPEDAADVGLIDVAQLPASRRFRGAWRLAGGAVRVHIPTARQLLLAQVRDARDRLLDSSDKEKAKLDDVGPPQQKAKLAQFRQALRDLPAAVQLELDQLTTPDELEAYTPTWPTYP